MHRNAVFGNVGKRTCLVLMIGFLLCNAPVVQAGSGALRPAVNYAVASGSYRPAVGDFNRDGALDVVIASYWSTNAVTVLMGNGDGTFQPAVDYLAGGSPLGIAVADLNGDGMPDLVTANWSGSNVSILLGNGD